MLQTFFCTLNVVCQVEELHETIIASYFLTNNNNKLQTLFSIIPFSIFSDFLKLCKCANRRYIQRKKIMKSTKSSRFGLGMSLIPNLSNSLAITPIIKVPHTVCSFLSSPSLFRNPISITQVEIFSSFILRFDHFKNA